jgi:hypothetical protein
LHFPKGKVEAISGGREVGGLGKRNKTSLKGFLELGGENRVLFWVMRILENAAKGEMSEKARGIIDTFLRTEERAMKDE